MIELRLIHNSDWHCEDEIVIDDYPSTIGRHPDCSVQVLHPLISRQHCRFFLKDGNIWVQDLESMNGTTINGKLLAVPQRLNEGDVLGLPCNCYTISMVTVSTC